MGGAISANVDALNAPINPLKRSILGTVAANPTEKNKQPITIDTAKTRCSHGIPRGLVKLSKIGY